MARLGLTDCLLTVELWFEGALPPLHDIQHLHQTVPNHLRACCGRVVLAQAGHLLAAQLVDGGVVANEISSHDGCVRTTTLLGAGSSLTSMLGLDQRGDVGVEASAPGVSEVGRRAGSQSEEPREAGESGLEGDMAQQGREDLGFLAEQQREQDDLEVPELRLAEAGAEGLSELPQSGIHPYNRHSHGAPCWLLVCLDTMLAP